MSEPTPEVELEPSAEPTPDETEEEEAHESQPDGTTPGESNPPTEEQIEGEPSPEGDAPPAPEEPQGLTQAEAEARFKKGDKAFESYAKRIDTIWEEEIVHLLPVSISPSAPPGFIDVRDAGRVPDEMQQPIMEFFGLARARDYKPDPQVGTCAGCEGEGLTATGSHVAGNDTRKCPQCRGFGYVPPPGAPTNGETPAADFHAPVGEAVAPLSDEERDMWGEAHLLPDGRENPNYGKMPQHKIQVSPWGITANLTVQDAPVPVEG